MKYDFDTMIDRRKTNSLKWNVNEDELSMWVADMDFKTAPCIQKVIQDKAVFGIFGYSDIPEEYYLGFQYWWNKRHNFHMEKDWMIFSSGVVPAISSIIRKLTTPAENVLIQSPVYNIFYNSIRNNGRNIISSNLIYENGIYQIDFEDLERKLKDPQTTMMILCNPHNPVGKIWSKKDLAKIGSLCLKYHVFVISDEVHCDLTEPGKQYIPFASIDKECEQNSITCISASKTFNLAGLQSACIVIPNEVIRHKVWRGLNTDEVAEPNIFACEATIAAFQDGEEWLEVLKNYIQKNKQAAQGFFEMKMPELRLVSSDATYLLWIDCSQLHPFINQFCNYLQENKHLLISSGIIFGENSEDFIRMNIACPTERMMEGLYKLEEGLKEFSEQFLFTC